MKIFKTETGAGISTNDEPKFERLKESEMITTQNIEQVKARRKAEADAAKAKEAQNEK